MEIPAEPRIFAACRDGSPGTPQRGTSRHVRSSARTRHSLAAAVVAAAAWFAPDAACSEGPADAAIGNVTYRAAIRHGQDGSDTDRYSGVLLAGERLSVRVDSPFLSGLYPRIALLGPDGVPRDVDIVRFGRLGRRLEIRDFEATETGRWTVQVTGELDSYGSYSVRFQVKPLPVVRTHVPADTTGAAPADITVPFSGLAASRIKVKASARRGPVPAIASLVDSSGNEVLDDRGEPVADSARKLNGRAMTLDVSGAGGSDGDYGVRITAPAGHREFTVTVQAIPVTRPRGVRRHRPDEPWIEPVAFAERGVHDLMLRIEGRNFSHLPQPAVLFDGIPATELDVDPYGTWIRCNPPVLPGGALAGVTVVNPDGQAYSRDGYYYYVPEPRIDDVVDSFDLPVRTGSSAGGTKVRILGAHFETGVYIRFGESEDVIPLIKSSGEITVTTPPHPAGEVSIVLLDGYLHEVVAPVTFTYE